KVVFTVCTGALILAQTGLLDGMKATTNKMVFYEKTPNHPKVNWVYHARWVHHNKYITSSGVTAGMDAALYIISLVRGKESAKEFADILEYSANFDPDQDPFAKVYES
ncbi:class I glutamine amidotransferase-like protein, partial [Neoconidiobolus thromboides FSU 785]